MSRKGRISYEYDFDYGAASGSAWIDVVHDLMNESAQLAVSRLRVLAPVDSGRLKGSHDAKREKTGASIMATVPYAEYVQPKGSKGRWRWWMAREFRNAFEDVSLARFGDVEDALLSAVGPVPRKGERAKARQTRISERRSGARASVATSPASLERSDRTANLAQGPR